MPSTRLFNRSSVWRFTFPFIQPKREFVNVAAHVLAIPMVVDSVVASLYHCPNAFNPVGMSHTVDVFPHAVLDRLVLIPRS